VIQTIATLSLGLGLALFYSWKLGLVTAAFVPVVLLAIVLEGRVTSAQSVLGKQALEAASKVRFNALKMSLLLFYLLKQILLLIALLSPAKKAQFFNISRSKINLFLNAQVNN
jgi:sterol desaturase/sphingolipid hydroxylase (fatty acid hydroxylase superfamily)